MIFDFLDFIFLIKTCAIACDKLNILIDNDKLMHLVDAKLSTWLFRYQIFIALLSLLIIVSFSLYHIIFFLIKLAIDGDELLEKRRTCGGGSKVKAVSKSKGSYLLKSQGTKFFYLRTFYLKKYHDASFLC